MTLPISIEHARELARLVEHETRPELVLVGAVALGNHLPLQRTTADIDLALLVSPADIVPLLTTLGWRRDEHMRQRWYGPAHFRADIIPATRELVATGTVQIDEGATMSLVGFDLAFEHAVAADLPGTSASVRVASLPAILVLKMVAWLDRPSERTKDLGDIAAVLTEALGETTTGVGTPRTRWSRASSTSPSRALSSRGSRSPPSRRTHTSWLSTHSSSSSSTSRKRLPR
jgi:predicted nucleotidyltransferase